jgi:hypothetical protein
MAFMRACHASTFNKDDFLLTLKILISSYFFVLLIQQVSVLIGIYPINLRVYNPALPFRLNSLGAEPSWSGRIVALLFYSYITVKESVVARPYSLKRDFFEDRYVWVAFLWTMLTMISGTAILFLSIVLIKFLKFKNTLLLGALSGALVFVAEFIEYQPYERVRDVAAATLTLDELAIIRADHSASFRIIPLIALAKSIELFSITGLTGHGVDSIANTLDFGLDDGVGNYTTASTLFAVWYEYGFIAFLVFVIFSLNLCFDRKNPVSLVFWFMLVFIYTLNVQIPWLAIMLLYMVKEYTANDRRVEY